MPAKGLAHQQAFLRIATSGLLSTLFCTGSLQRYRRHRGKPSSGVLQGRVQIWYPKSILPFLLGNRGECAQLNKCAARLPCSSSHQRDGSGGWQMGLQECSFRRWQTANPLSLCITVSSFCLGMWGFSSHPGTNRMEITFSEWKSKGQRELGPRWLHESSTPALTIYCQTLL